MQVIYADTIFIINFIINYLILLATARICAVRTTRWRIAIAGAAGGIYSVMAVMPPLVFWGNPLVKIVFGALMVYTAFGWRDGLLRVVLVFFAVSAAFAGALLAVSLLSGDGRAGLMTPVSFRVLVLSFAVCYAAVTLVFRHVARVRGKLVSLTVRNGGREIRMVALIDTGNSLRDPITGGAVIVTGVSAAKKLFTRAVEDAVAELCSRDAAKVLEELAQTGTGVKFRLVPYSAVGVSGGMLLAFRPDEILVDGVRRTDLIIALSPNNITDNGTYSALMGA